MLKVLVSDNIAQSGIDILKEQVEVDVATDLTRQQFLNRISDYEGIILRSMTNIDREALEKARNLKVIGRAGTGYDNIDIEEATKKGVVVFNTPTGNTISAVEHTMGMILALSRNIAQANQALHQGIWDRKKYMGTELKGKILGIIGLGKIGSRVARRAQAFDMKVIANDPYLPPEKAEKINVPLLDFKEVLQKSDYISLHTPLTDETYHILSHKEFAIMKDGVRIINCARGENLDTEALSQALASNKVKQAAIDVHEQEPLSTEDNPLLEFEDRVIMTCHLGGTTREAMDNVSTEAARQVLKVLDKGLPDSPLNIPTIDSRELNQVKPYLNLINRMGQLMAHWKGQERIEEIELEYGGKINQYQHKPFTISFVKSMLDPILDNRVNLVNALIIAKERGIKIKDSTINNPEGLTNIVKTTIKARGEQYSITGTHLPIGPRIIEIDDCRIDFNLEGKFLMAIYLDKPGVVGRIGTILGNEDINIANMHVGRQQEGGEAVMVLQTDSKPSSSTLEKIKQGVKHVNLQNLTCFEL
ncbi:MAG: phosphoglycerate dehydrogenase [Bacillota bacterium]